MLALRGAALLVLLCGNTIVRDVPGFLHTRWSSADGAPAEIRAIVQSKDGYLWLGSSSGLYRFDGLSFEHIPFVGADRFRSNQVTALAVAPDGKLWVGYQYGGIAIYQDGRLQNANPDRPRGNVSAITVDPSGSVWIAYDSGFGPMLRRWRRGQWTTFEAGSGLLDEPLQQIFASRDGSLWIAQFPHLLRLRPGASKPEETGISLEDHVAFTQTKDGTVWVLSRTGLYQLGRPGKATPTIVDRKGSGGSESRALLEDPDGKIWVVGDDDDLAQVIPGDTPAVAHRFADLRLNTLFRDREGTLWGGGYDGLERFARSAITFENLRQKVTTGFVRPGGNQRGFYLGTNSGAYWVDDATSQKVFEQGNVNALCAGPNGLLWFDTGLGSFQKTRAGTTPIHDPGKGSAPLDCSIDDRGRIRVSVVPDGIFRREGQNWVREDRWPAVPYLLADGEDRFFASQPMKALYYLTPEGAKPLLTGDQVRIGFIKMMKRVGDAVYFGGDAGLMRLKNGHLQVLLAARYPWLSEVLGIADDGSHVWIIGDRGIFRVRSDALDRAFASPGSALAAERIGAEQGIVARTGTFNAGDVEINSDGKIWFISNQGILHVDPARLARDGPPPPVAITKLLVGGKPVDRDNVILPAGTEQFQVEFAGLSLFDAEHNRYRYMLEGSDKTWVEAGPSRQASYTHLGPGTYRFIVSASNPDGKWSTSPARMTIVIRPFVWQTWWFRTAALLCLLLLGAALVYWRFRVATAEVRRRHEARLAERERIARELHDTLLQGFHALVLRLHGILTRLPAGSDIHDEFEQALERADDVLLEGRTRVSHLRGEAGPVNLKGVVTRLVDNMVADTKAVQPVMEKGRPKNVRAPVADEIEHIVGEAVANALKHADPGMVRIELAHSRKSLSVIVSDDGRGLPDDVLENGSRRGHYGLVGMQERAGAIGAVLSVGSRVPGGTEVRLVVPARNAYA